MRFLPRFTQDNYTTNIFTGIAGMVRQLLGTMTLMPVYRVLHLVVPRATTYQAAVDMISSTGTGAIYNYWGVDASLSPALLLLLAGGALACLFRRPDLKASSTKNDWLPNYAWYWQSG